MRWFFSHRADRRALPIADRHYNRQKIGSPQFVPPGRCLVLLTQSADALWVTSWPFAEYVRHDWAGAWVNSCFRNESTSLSSALIQDAVAATVHVWPGYPSLDCKHCGDTVTFVSFINTKEVRKRDRGWGKCYVKAGWKICSGRTKAGLVVAHLATKSLPRGIEPNNHQLAMEFAS